MALGPVLVGIDGTRLDDATTHVLRHPLVGGVVLFTRNFIDPGQLQSLVADIRAVRSPRLLLAVDQEGGRVQRFQEGFSRLPPLGALGALARLDCERAEEYAFWHGRLMASEMLEVGIDISFAPVLDLDRGSNVIGDRAFSADPDIVIRLGRRYLDGMHAAGMRTTGKHFPGHGSVVADSHLADVCDERSLEDICATDLRPFAELAPLLDAMMIAHVVYPCLDTRPAGYSTAWLGDQLRRRMGYEGLIFSDDLGMHAAKVEGGVAARAEASFQAGCDSVLVCIPEDVTTLIADWGERPVRDANDRLTALYGVAMQGESAAELEAWRTRLERLC